MSAKQEANPAKLASFIRKHHPAGNALRAATEPETVDLVDLFVHSYLLWQAPSSDANAALKRLKAAFIDWNDMRVSLTSDLVDVIGHRFWRASDRIARLRDAMNGVYRREHKVCLDRLRTLMKKDAVSYMETLPGMIPFVANRVLLVGVDFHSVPLEEFGMQLLVQHGAIPQGMSLSEAQGWVNRHVKAEEARDAHRAIVAGVDHMWETNPPKLPKSATKPAEMAPPKPLEEARAAARALVSLMPGVGAVRRHSYRPFSRTSSSSVGAIHAPSMSSAGMCGGTGTLRNSAMPSRCSSVTPPSFCRFTR